jgi:hypothetical protein
MQAMADVQRYGLGAGLSGYDDLLGLNHESAHWTSGRNKLLMGEVVR